MNTTSSPSRAQNRVSTGLDPFVHSQDSKSYFETPAIRQRIDLVRHLVDFGRQIIVVSGPPGAGKSAMLAQICDESSVSCRLLQFIGGPALNQSTLLSKIAEQLEIPMPADKTRLPESIRRAIKTANDRGETIVLTIDDAHKLPSDTPSALSQLAHSVDESSELKIIVAADPSQTPIVEHLQQSASGQTLVHVVEVPRFNNQQLLALLKHRWNAAYATEDIPLDDAEIAQIYQQSNGVPGKAIVLARQVQILSERPQRSGPDPARRYVIFGVGLIGVFLLFAFFNAEKSSESLNSEIELELPSLKPEKPSALQLPSGQAPEPPLQTSAPVAKSVEQRIDPTRNAPDRDVATPIPQVVPSASQPPVEPVIRETLAPDKQIDSGPDDGAKASERKPGESTPDEEPPKIQVTIRSDSNPSKPAVTPSAAKPVEQQPETKVPTAPAVARDETIVRNKTPRYSIQWLKQQPSTGYVLQLFGGRNRAAAEKFILEKNIVSDSDLLVTEHAGGPWYVVVYKYYPDRIAAQRAIRQLPADLSSTKPWSRPISSLK